MNINATLLGQMLTFGIFVWFTMKYVWPPLTEAMSERQKKIADGLAAAEEGQKSLVEAETKAKQAVVEAKSSASEIIDQAHKRAQQIVDEAKNSAKEEGERILAAARTEIDQEYSRAKEQLRAQVVTIAMAGAEKVLEDSIDEAKHQSLLQKLAAEI